MCGIVGYVGNEQAAPIILDGLSKLEYRGYDSAGMAIFNGEHIKIEKSVGRLKVLEELTHDGATMPGLYKKSLSNIVEVKSRGAFVLAVTNVGNTEIEKTADYVIYIPETNPYFTDSLAIIPLQLFAYYVSVGKGCDVDRPRNLAKSVTVE